MTYDDMPIGIVAVIGTLERLATKIETVLLLLVGLIIITTVVQSGNALEDALADVAIYQTRPHFATQVQAFEEQLATYAEQAGFGSVHLIIETSNGRPIYDRLQYLNDSIPSITITMIGDAVFPAVTEETFVLEVYPHNIHPGNEVHAAVFGYATPQLRAGIADLAVKVARKEIYTVPSLQFFHMELAAPLIPSMILVLAYMCRQLLHAFMLELHTLEEEKLRVIDQYVAQHPPHAAGTRITGFMRMLPHVRRRPKTPVPQQHIRRPPARRELDHAIHALIPTILVRNMPTHWWCPCSTRFILMVSFLALANVVLVAPAINLYDYPDFTGALTVDSAAVTTTLIQGGAVLGALWIIKRPLTAVLQSLHPAGR